MCVNNSVKCGDLIVIYFVTKSAEMAMLRGFSGLLGLQLYCFNSAKCGLNCFGMDCMVKSCPVSAVGVQNGEKCPRVVDI